MKKILIANRGEIAVRIINTCRLMGIETVAVVAQDDRDSLHWKMADQWFCLGEGPLAETYLNGDKIIELALKAGAQAIHPGYGFLSERASFCESCQSAGITFIGPSREAIQLMGDKGESKRTMERLGIPVVPGFHEEQDDPEKLKTRAQELGTPLLIKAIAGGGGKGNAPGGRHEDLFRATGPSPARGSVVLWGLSGDFGKIYFQPPPYRSSDAQ